jgi:hypothetical protein
LILLGYHNIFLHGPTIGPPLPGRLSFRQQDFREFSRLRNQGWRQGSAKRPDFFSGEYKVLRTPSGATRMVHGVLESLAV